MCVCVYLDEKELTFNICTLVLWLFKNIFSFVPFFYSLLPSSEAATISFFKINNGIGQTSRRYHLHKNPSYFYPSCVIFP